MFLTFSYAKKYFSEKKSKVIGQILNPELFDTQEKTQTSGDKDIPQVLIIGGSQGSARIFRFILEHIDAFSTVHLHVVLGKLNADFRKFFEPYPFVSVYDFLSQNELAMLYPRIDTAITRAGATALAELSAFGIQLIIIPLPESANNHQYYNAKDYE